MAKFIPDHGQWVVFKAKLPDGCEAMLDLKRKAGPASDEQQAVELHAEHTSPIHKTDDGFLVGVYHAPKPSGSLVNGQPQGTTPPRIWLVNVLGYNVPSIHYGNVQFPRWQQNVTFAMDEVADLAGADTDDLPPGRHPTAPSRNESGVPPASVLQRPKRKRA